MVSVGAVAGVMVVLFFVLAMLCMFMRRSREEAAAQDAAVTAVMVAAAGPPGNAADASSVLRRGLDEGIVQRLPLYQLPPSLFMSPEPCPICLSSFLQGQFYGGGKKLPARVQGTALSVQNLTMVNVIEGKQGNGAVSPQGEILRFGERDREKSLFNVLSPQVTVYSRWNLSV